MARKIDFELGVDKKSKWGVPVVAVVNESE